LEEVKDVEKGTKMTSKGLKKVTEKKKFDKIATVDRKGRISIRPEFQNGPYVVANLDNTGARLYKIKLTSLAIGGAAKRFMKDDANYVQQNNGEDWYTVYLPNAGVVGYKGVIDLFLANGRFANKADKNKIRYNLEGRNDMVVITADNINDDAVVELIDNLSQFGKGGNQKFRRFDADRAVWLYEVAVYCESKGALAEGEEFTVEKAPVKKGKGPGFSVKRDGPTTAQKVAKLQETWEGRRTVKDGEKGDKYMSYTITNIIDKKTGKNKGSTYTPTVRPLASSAKTVVLRDWPVGTAEIMEGPGKNIEDVKADWVGFFTAIASEIGMSKQELNDVVSEIENDDQFWHPNGASPFMADRKKKAKKAKKAGKTSKGTHVSAVFKK
jgi:hypothetical protein